MNFGVKQILLKNKLTINCTITDIFNTQKWVTEAENVYFNIQNTSKYPTRIIWFGVSYSINNYTKKDKQENGETENNVIKIGQ